MKRLLIILFFLGIATFIAVACSGTTGLEVTDAWARPGVVGQNTAVYFNIENSQAVGDTLLRASSDVAGAVELHMSMMVKPEEEAGEEGEMGDEMEGDVMRMVPQEFVDVPANSTVNFEPGGLHVMLIDLKKDLNEGETLAVTLQFEGAGEITLQVPIELR